MATLDFYVTYSNADGSENKLLCSSIDHKMAVKDISDQRNNIKNTFMPWQCQNIQDDEISLKVEISSTCGNKTSMCVNSKVYKENSQHTDAYNAANYEDQIDLKSDLPNFKSIMNDSKEDNNPLNAASNYNCSLCGYKCKNKSIFTNHLLSHGIESIIQSEVLKSEKYLNKHMCSECNYKTTNRAMYNKHIVKLKHKTLSCPECNEKFGSTFDMHKHKLIHAIGSEFACPLCDYKGQKLIEMKRHLLKHSEKRFFKCSKCVFASSLISTLEKHMFSHSEKSDVCNESEAKVKTKLAGSQVSTLDKHMFSHTDKSDSNNNSVDKVKTELDCSQVSTLEKHMFSHIEKSEGNNNGEGKKKTDGRKVRFNIIQNYDRKDIRHLVSFWNTKL